MFTYAIDGIRIRRSKFYSLTKEKTLGMAL